METKKVEQLARTECPYYLERREAHIYIKAFIAGYTAAQSEQSEMVKKSDVVNVIKDALSYFNNTGPIGTQLTCNRLPALYWNHYSFHLFIRPRPTNHINPS